MTLYRIASYLLLMMAILLGAIDLMVLLIALANPAMLIQVFIIACVVIYSFTSFSFLIKGIDRQQLLRKRTKDLIKVNAYVSMGFGMLFLLQTIAIVSNPQLIGEAMKQATQMQGAEAAQLTPQMLMKLMRYVLYFMCGYSIVLVLHVFYTLKLLKTHAHLFASEQNEG